MTYWYYPGNSRHNSPDAFFTEKFTFLQILFETVSLRHRWFVYRYHPELSMAGRPIVIMMFIGRMGPLTLVMALAQRASTYRLPPSKSE
jgi:hypothetical protein